MEWLEITSTHSTPLYIRFSLSLYICIYTHVYTSISLSLYRSIYLYIYIYTHICTNIHIQIQVLTTQQPNNEYNASAGGRALEMLLVLTFRHPCSRYLSVLFPWPTLTKHSKGLPQVQQMTDNNMFRQRLCGRT